MNAGLDAVIICGDTPLEVLGKDEREKARLTIDGIPASLAFLREYFSAGHDPQKALENTRRNQAPFLSLNGPYLSQFLESQGFSTALVPLFSEDRPRLLDALRRNPRAVVISTTFLPFAKQIDAIAGFVKKQAPAAQVIAGGIQVWKSFRHRELLEQGLITDDIRAAVAEHNYLMDPSRPSPVDLFLVSDTGETTLARVLETLRRGEDPAELDNVASFREGQWRLNRVTPDPYHEVRVDWSRFLPGPTSAYVPIQAGIGCGFDCTFCDFRGLRPVRVRPAESLVEEIRTIPPHEGVRRVYFTDDNLFATKRRVQEVCGALIRADLGVRWRGLVRVSIVDEEVADLMARSGCLEVLLGIESGDPEILRRMGKRVTPEQILAGVGHLARSGINTKSTFIVGFPGETDRSIQNTVDLLNAYPTDAPAAHRYLFFTFAVLPLSEVSSPESRARYGVRGYGYEWSHATLNAREAAEKLAALQDRLKPELSPNYVQEVPELPGLTIRDIREVYCARNHLARARRGLAAPETEEILWKRLGRIFVGGP